MALKKILKAYRIVHHHGPGFCAFRAKYALRKKTGLLKRKFPARRWSQISLAEWLGPDVDRRPQRFLQNHRANGRRFFFDSGDLPGLNNCYREKVMPPADEICQNKFQYFFDKSYDLGPGPNWFLNPATGAVADADRHWCDIDIFDPDLGDIKFVWEPSRFAWVYTLVRAYAATGDNKYVDKFWSLFESWLDANQPNTGQNYACGQECAIRLMAMCFALYGLADAEGSSVERKTALITAIAVHADRIEKNIDYAVSTRTNHSLTEAAGLYTAGVLFPQFQRSRNWVKLGKRVLTNEGLKQIYPDGAYIQHSMNYHRLMLQDLLWTIRLAQLNGDSFCAELLSRAGRAVDFLYQMQDEAGGRVPNYGANDGAMIIPLNNCDYLDYRPVIQSVHYLLNGVRLYEQGPWDEDLLWFFSSQALAAPLQPAERGNKAYKAGGYYTIRNKNDWAMIRCHSYKDRPGHADMMHLDLWWKGINVLRDSGTYMYNCQQTWQNYFSSTMAHNTVALDGVDQMTRASRFMWFDWVKAKLTVHNSFDDGFAKVMQGRHYGYCRKNNNLIHRRAVLTLPNIWLIVDDVLGTGAHQIGLYWQLCDADFELKDNALILQTGHGPVCLTILDSAGRGKCRCFTGDDGPIGWQSLYYGNRSPAPALLCSETADLPVRLVTLVALDNTIKNAALDKTNTVSWILEPSKQKYSVTLNSIESSEGGTFVSAYREEQNHIDYSVELLDQPLKEAMPSCPICGDTKKILLYGRQQYLVGKGQVDSLIFRCRECDFNFRRFDRPLSEVLSHFKVAPYSTDEIEQQWLKRREGFYQFLLNLLSKPTAGKSLLDIGCAFGHFLDCAVQRGYRPFGTEVSEEMADLSRKHKDYHVTSRPLSDLQLPEKQFDVITFVDSFYYFEDPLETLRHCHKLLKPGGELLMRVTNRNQMAKFHRLVRALTFQAGKVSEMPFWTTDDAISCHSRRSLVELMNRTGFRIIRLTCLEKGKKIDSFNLRAFYRLTSALARITSERICLTPGIICLATTE